MADIAVGYDPDTGAVYYCDGAVCEDCGGAAPPGPTYLITMNNVLPPPNAQEVFGGLATSPIPNSNTAGTCCTGSARKITGKDGIMTVVVVPSGGYGSEVGEIVVSGILPCNCPGLSWASDPNGTYDNFELSYGTTYEDDTSNTDWRIIIEVDPA